MVTEVRKWRADDGQIYDTEAEAVQAEAIYNARCAIETLLRDCGCNDRSDMDDVIGALLSEPTCAEEIFAEFNTAMKATASGKTGDN